MTKQYKKKFEKSQDKDGVHKSNAGFVKKFRYNKQLTPTSSTLFSDGNPRSFGLMRKKIEDRFYQNECLDLITYDAATVANPPVETTFTLNEPTELDMVTNQIINNRASTILHWNAIGLLVTANAPGISAADLAKIQMQNAQKEVEALRSVDMTRTSLLSLFHSAHSNWLKLKDKHNSKLATCNKTFYNTFGSNVLSCVQDLLHENRFRAAWKYIVDKYAVNIGGQQNASNIMNELTTLCYDHSKGMTTHMNKVNNMFNQMETFGEPPISENMKMAYLVGTIQRSSNKHFQQVIDMHSIMNWTYNELAQQLYKRESILLVSNNNNNNHKDDYNMHHNESANSSNDNKRKKYNKYINKENINNSNTDSNSKSSNDTAVTCGHCKRTGHSTDNCFHLHPCSNCGRFGHSPNVCYHKKKESNNSDIENQNNRQSTNSFEPRQFGPNTSRN